MLHRDTGMVRVRGHSGFDVSRDWTHAKLDQSIARAGILLRSESCQLQVTDAREVLGRVSVALVVVVAIDDGPIAQLRDPLPRSGSSNAD